MQNSTACDDIAFLLVCDVDGPSGRFHHRRSDERVAGGEPFKHGMMMVRPVSAGGRVSAHNAHGPELTALTPARVVRPMVSILCP